MRIVCIFYSVFISRQELPHPVCNQLLFPFYCVKFRLFDSRSNGTNKAIIRNHNSFRVVKPTFPICNKCPFMRNVVAKWNRKANAIDHNRQTSIRAGLFRQDFGAAGIFLVKLWRQSNELHCGPFQKMPSVRTEGKTSIELSFDYAVRALRTNHLLSFLFVREPCSGASSTWTTPHFYYTQMKNKVNKNEMAIYTNIHHVN